MSEFAAELVVSYSRTAEVGKRYLLEVDLQHDPEAWSLRSEEYPIRCIVDVEAFACEAVGDAAIVMHRFGGSYCPARFILEALAATDAAKLRILLLDTRGSVVYSRALDPIRVVPQPLTATTPAADNSNQISIGVADQLDISVVEADRPTRGDPIAMLVAGRYPDPETGEQLGVSARSVVIDDSLDGREVELVATLKLGHHLAVVSDEDTYAALGRRVERALSSRFAVQRLVLHRSPRADAATVAQLVASLDASTDAIVAVGSGTINDLCKMAALARGCPQIVFATAPSMTGYTSAIASITEAGLLRSVRTTTPVGAFFDLTVMASAPVRLIRAGLGHCVSRPTAQADWLLAHLLLDRTYREAPFAMLAGDEAALLSQTRALVSDDLTAMRHLVRMLVLSGFAMTIVGNRYSGDQGAHLLSQYVNVMRPPDIAGALQGEQIGVCALAMARLQERILGLDEPPVLHATAIEQADVLHHFGPERGEAYWQNFAPKRLDRQRADELNARLAGGWDTMRARIEAVALGSTYMTSVLAAAGAPVMPNQLGWSDRLLADAILHAREMHDRYTFLDFAADLESTPR